MARIRTPELSADRARVLGHPQCGHIHRLLADNPDGLSTSTLRAELGIDGHTLRRYADALVAVGLAEVIPGGRGRNRPNIYRAAGGDRP